MAKQALREELVQAERPAAVLAERAVAKQALRAKAGRPVAVAEVARVEPEVSPSEAQEVLLEARSAAGVRVPAVRPVGVGPPAAPEEVARHPARTTRIANPRISAATARAATALLKSHAAPGRPAFC
jgi:hypothetical protein